MSSELQIVPNAIGINILGLNKGQAALYRYFLECEKEQKQIDMWRITEIYYKNVNSSNAKKYYDGSKWVDCTIDEYLKHRKESDPAYAHYWSKNWLKGNIGSFVLRGLLSVMPKFKPEEMAE